MNGVRNQEWATTASKELPIKIIRQRESEIELGLFKVGWGASE